MTNKHYPGYKVPRSFIIVNAYRDMMAMGSNRTFAIRAINSDASKIDNTLWMFCALTLIEIKRSAGK